MDTAKELQLLQWKSRLQQIPLRRTLTEENCKKKLAALDAEEKRLEAAVKKAESPEPEGNVTFSGKATE